MELHNCEEVNKRAHTVCKIKRDDDANESASVDKTFLTQTVVCFATARYHTRVCSCNRMSLEAARRVQCTLKRPFVKRAAAAATRFGHVDLSRLTHRCARPVHRRELRAIADCHLNDAATGCTCRHFWRAFSLLMSGFRVRALCCRVGCC
jgi:hypothetical protein